jgi:4-diphosphocytidyl-2-C-methyl-D-erythritol kinase
MPKLKALAPAKINLTFDILGTMPDGYHQVETLLQSVDLMDECAFDIVDAAQTEINIALEDQLLKRSEFPLGPDNLIAKAATLFSVETGKNFRADVLVNKVIPIGAGLAGGSADAAATLVALNEHFGRPLTTSKLIELGRGLGADVPFCIEGGTALGTHRGDHLSPVQSLLSFTFCIVKPLKISVSTPWAYGKFDEYGGTINKPDTALAAEALKNGDLQAAVDSFGNVFEPVIFAEHPVLKELKATLLKHGAWHVQLSGSGPALFAIAADIEHAHYIRRKILKTDDAGFAYGDSYPVSEFGPPIEFHICQSSTTGIRTPCARTNG